MATRGIVERSTVEESVSEEVISAVANAKGVDPIDLVPLYEVVDPDALDALFEEGGFGRPGSPDRVEFVYSDCEVVIGGDGSVTVTPT